MWKAAAHFPDKFTRNKVYSLVPGYQNTIQKTFLYSFSDWTRRSWIYILHLLSLCSMNILLSVGSLKKSGGKVFLYSFLLLCALLCIDDNAGNQMDWQNTSLLALCKAEHVHAGIVFANCCGDLQLPGKQSVSALTLFGFLCSEAGTLLKAFQLTWSWQRSVLSRKCSAKLEGTAWAAALWEFPREVLSIPKTSMILWKHQSVKFLIGQTTQDCNTDTGGGPRKQVLKRKGHTIACLSGTKIVCV